MRLTTLVSIVLCLNACTTLPKATSVSAALTDSCIDGSGVHHVPDPDLTPGALCTADDPDLVGFRYPLRVPICQRNVNASKKSHVAITYGIPRDDYAKYEFDHYIPLSIGGSNSVQNLWPQPIDEALDKDRVEERAYVGLRSGRLTRQQAVDMIRAWRPTTCP